MEHYAQNIEGFFDASDFGFYRLIVEQAPQHSHFIEVGAWKGRSTSYMAVEIYNSGKNIQFDVVDTFAGSAELMGDADVVKGSLFETFKQNMLPVKDLYTPVVMESITASRIYENNSIDFVFIDASHDFESVSSDIKAWLPKVKQGGIISGHDYHHGPVRTAVSYRLGSAINIHGSCWYTIK